MNSVPVPLREAWLHWLRHDAAPLTEPRLGRLDRRRCQLARTRRHADTPTRYPQQGADTPNGTPTLAGLQWDAPER